MMLSVTSTFDGLTSKFIGTNYTIRLNIYAKFDKPISILCIIMSRIRFASYIIKLEVILTLAFDGLSSKSIGTIYTWRLISVSNFKISLCIYQPGQGCSIYQ